MDVQKVGRRPAFSNSSCFSWGGVDSVMCQLAIVLRSASWERDREDLRGLLRTLDEVLKWRGQLRTIPPRYGLCCPVDPGPVKKTKIPECRDNGTLFLLTRDKS
nr:hypothetical protein BgiMline_006771 [Biomphalaria glabrata]